MMNSLKLLTVILAGLWFAACAHPSAPEATKPQEKKAEQTTQESPSSTSQTETAEGQEASEKSQSGQAASQETADSKLEEARKNLRISETTEKRIASELEELKKSGSASPETVKDYEIYHESVKAMVAENRKIVEQMEAAQTRHSSGTNESSASASGEMGKMLDPEIPEGETGDEVAALDRQLNASLNEFDAKLLKEMDEIRGESAEKMRDLAQEAAEAAKRLRERGVDVNTSGSESSEASEETETEQGTEGAKTASSEASRQGGKGSGGKEQDRAGYEDDDIVARQLREAAENETDPELKEKLWKEYHEYKKSR